MKNLFLTLSTFLSLSATAGVITCSNNANSPGQYTDLQDAIDNANANDTILVSGSNQFYPSININDKSLTIIGAGYNNPNGESTHISTINLNKLTASISSSGSKIIGVHVDNIIISGIGGTGSNSGIQNITIERCHITSLLRIGYDSGLYSNIEIFNCLFECSAIQVGAGSGNTFPTFTNVKIHNNLFSNKISISAYNRLLFNNNSDNSSVVFENNIYTGYGSAPSLFAASNTQNGNNGPIFLSNIFYNVDPSDCINCSFSNNLTYLCSNDDMLSGINPGSTGGANLIGQNPLFVNYPTIGGLWSFNYDLSLQISSPAIGAGVSGVDIGIYGGTSPFEVGTNPAIPQMQEITTPLGAAVSQGTNLNVTFKSYKQD